MDEELRRLHREYQATGDPATGAIWLKRRIASGSLTLEQVTLLSYLENRAAQLLVPAERTICTPVEQSRYVDSIAHFWEQNLQPFNILYQALLLSVRRVLDDLEDTSNELRAQWIDAHWEMLDLLHQTHAECEAAFRGDASMPMIQGDLMQAYAYQHERSPLYFAIMAVFNLGETLIAHYHHLEAETSGHARRCFHNVLEYFPYEREHLCQYLATALASQILN